MRIFQEVPLPPTCYIAEAALWVALGRVPQTVVKVSDVGHDYSERDPRTNRAALDEDDVILWFDPGFSKSEFQHLGVEVDWDRYAMTKEFVTTSYPYLNKPTGDDVVKAIRHQESLFSVMKVKHVPKSDEFVNAVKMAVDWANSIDAECDATVDIARTEVFKALAKGDLVALAWREAPGELRNADPDMPLVSIPASHWSMRGFNWEQSELRHSSGDYYAVQVPTSGMLAKFPRPQCAAEARTTEFYPSCILVEDDGTGAKLSPAMRARGRPAKGDGLIKKAVRNVFTYRATRGELPDKTEALLQEVIDYVALAFEETISRTTAQQYIKSLPQNGARK